MKHAASIQKTPQAPAHSADSALPAGPDGVALAPPAYGVAAVDSQVVQRSAAPATTRDSAPGIPQPNRTGLPGQLKSGVEALSSMSLDDVRVHFNSSRPAQLHALAYTQGNEIYVAPGQERHLPHEAWHVVQQKQGRVRATRQLKVGVAVNDDAGLEREADVMGRRVAQLQGAMPSSAPVRISAPIPAGDGSYKLLAGEGGQQVGSVMVHAKNNASIEVTDLGVDQAHRAQGIGKQLIASAARMSQQLGKAKMALAAQDSGSGRLTQWYKRMGFTQVGTHQSGYPQLEAPIGRVLGGVAQRKGLHHYDDNSDRSDRAVSKVQAFIAHSPRNQSIDRDYASTAYTQGRCIVQAMEGPKKYVPPFKRGGDKPALGAAMPEGDTRAQVLQKAGWKKAGLDFYSRNNYPHVHIRVLNPDHLANDLDMATILQDVTMVAISYGQPHGPVAGPTVVGGMRGGITVLQNGVALADVHAGFGDHYASLPQTEKDKYDDVKKALAAKAVPVVIP
jgi:ribosomal protein S18 acetylase RimI-like enzyme